MIEILDRIFGKSIKEEIYDFPSDAPLLISHGYGASRITLGNSSCILVKPKFDGYTLKSLKKQLCRIRDICGEPVVVELKRLTALQWTNLIESGISFVAESGQVFIPFWGSYFEERISNLPNPTKLMSANAQIVFLYLLYNVEGNGKKVNQACISKELQISKMTCSRAVRQLRALNLVTVFEDGTSNYIGITDRESIVESAFSHMESPVQKRIFVKRVPDGINGKLCGIKALSEKTLISEIDGDAGFAISKSELGKIDSEYVIDEQTFRDFGGEIIEVWKYDPCLLSDDDCVDELSLIVELQHEEDERVQKELDKIRSKYGLKEQ